MSNFNTNALYKKQIYNKHNLRKKSNDHKFVLFLQAILKLSWKTEPINISTI